MFGRKKKKLLVCKWKLNSEGFGLRLIDGAIILFVRLEVSEGNTKYDKQLSNMGAMNSTIVWAFRNIHELWRTYPAHRSWRNPSKKENTITIMNA